jgi:hypothetical protein
LFSCQARPLCEFRFPPESYPTDPSRPTEVRQPLSWASAPFSTRQDRRSTTRGLCLPASFRLQGLTTLLTAYALRSPAGFVSHRRRPWDCPFGACPADRSPGVSTRMNPPTVSPAVVPVRLRAGPALQAAVPGLSPCRRSRRPAVGLARQPTEAPLGFTLPGLATRAWVGISPNLLSRAFPVEPCDSTARRPTVSISSGLVPPWLRGCPSRRGRTALIGFPHRSDPEHSSVYLPGLCVHLSPRRTSLPTGRRSVDRNARPT